jgi:hypothetical protein
VQALDYWKAVTADQSGFLERIVTLLSASGLRYCIIGGQAVNAYVEPVVSLDLDVAVAASDLGPAEALFPRDFKVERFAPSTNVTAPKSELRLQLQTDPRYAAFVERASMRLVLGLELPVAALEDVLQGKVWAAQDPTRRASKRQEDLADISRLLEAFPELRARVPADVLTHLI